MLRVQDLRHLVSFVFRQPNEETVIEDVHKSILDIVKHHDAKEPLSKDDLSFIE